MRRAPDAEAAAPRAGRTGTRGRLGRRGRARGVRRRSASELRRGTRLLRKLSRRELHDGANVRAPHASLRHLVAGRGGRGPRSPERRGVRGGARALPDALETRRSRDRDGRARRGGAAFWAPSAPPPRCARRWRARREARARARAPSPAGGAGRGANSPVARGFLSDGEGGSAQGGRLDRHGGSDAARTARTGARSRCRWRRFSGATCGGYDDDGDGRRAAREKQTRFAETARLARGGRLQGARAETRRGVLLEPAVPGVHQRRRRAAEPRWRCPRSGCRPTWGRRRTSPWGAPPSADSATPSPSSTRTRRTR